MPEPDPAKFTPLLNLYKPDRGESGWGPALNVNADILDEILQGLRYTFENINIIKLGGNPIATNKGVATPGTMRVAICNDDTNLNQIEVNTRSAASSSTNIATRLSAPLGVHIYDNLDQTLGIHVRPLIVYNPLNQYNNPIPITVKLCNEVGLDLDLGKGLATPTTLRTVTASDSPDTLALEHIDTMYGRSLNAVTLSNSNIINIQNTVLREVSGQLTGIRAHPLYVSLMQDNNPLIFTFSAGNYDNHTLRVVNATNDPNLAAINTYTHTVSDATVEFGGAAPDRIMMVGKVHEHFAYKHSLKLCDTISTPQPYGSPAIEELFGPFTFNWSGSGEVIFSGSKDGVGLFHMDDSFRITIENSGGIEHYYEDPNPARAREPVDITHLCSTGINTISLRTWSTIPDHYGHSEGWITFESSDGGVSNATVLPLKGHDDGGTLTHVVGGIVGASLKDDTGARMGVLNYPLFFRNADHPDDRGQSARKPFYTTVVDPVQIGNGVNIIQLGGHSISRKRGNIEEGTQRVCIADDDTNTTRIVIQLNVIIEKLKWIIEHPDVKYTVMAFVSSGEGLIIPPHVTVTSGRDANFSIIPSDGWALKEVYLDGSLVGNTNTTQSVRNITEDHTLTVAFEELPETRFTITSSVLGGQGVISPTGTITVADGGTETFNIVPASGWELDELWVDDLITTVAGPSTAPTPFIFTNVHENHTIGATFKVAEAESHKITSYIIGSITPDFFTITSSIIAGQGTISPLGTISVLEGGEKTFIVTPASDWEIQDVRLDGTSLTSSGTFTTPFQHTITNVRQNHTITASFHQPDAPVPPINPNPGIIYPSFTAERIAPLTYKFTDTSTENPHTWRWQFDGVGSSTEQNPTYTFSSAGLHTVNLWVRNDASQSQIEDRFFLVE